MTSRFTMKALVAVLLAAGTLTLGADAAGAEPREEIFQGNDQTWLCYEDGFPAPSHCENIRSRGQTGVILVFPPDDRGPAEGVSGVRADNRPCPHDPGSPDGTWWEVIPDVYVCHHQP
ncbi:MAG: hypothetical protein HKN94_11010 [Acidimicrobiales bacterium]|nr:hypothetical protein [Acidimicrobiales bacterium]RZV48586.1 MAG: hypothetical protein EX269_01045 [Acidimicrobiales bacterium]